LRLHALCAAALILTVPAASRAEAPVSPRVERAGPQAARGTRLQGVAFISRNRKVTGASVLVRPKGDTSQLYVTSSDHGGVFQIDSLPDGPYRVEVQREGMAREIKDDIVLRFPFRAVVDLPMEPASAERPDVQVPDAPAGKQRSIELTGRVIDREGAPLADVVLNLARWDGLSDPVHLRTAADGTFVVPELLAGPWRLEVEGVGYLPIRIGLPLEQSAELHVVLVEQPADYRPSPLELMPPEEPSAPAGLPEPLIVD
jgi:hypothetical protein